MESDTIGRLKEGVEKAITHLQEELKKMRTGRAHPGMLDGITAEAYGQPMPLIQLATITAPEPQLLQLTPFDPNNLQAIASAIRDNQALGLNPIDDGRIVRVPIPPLTEERRRQVAKLLGEKAEEAMISIRNVRHEAMKDLDQGKKDKSISEDEFKRLVKQVDDAMSEAKDRIDATAKAKEEEILKL